MDQPASIAAIAAIGVFTMALGLWVRADRRARHARLGRFVGGNRTSRRAAEDAAPDSPGAGPLRHLDRALARRAIGRRARLELLRAGIALSPSHLLLLRAALALLGLVVARIAAQGLPWAAQLAAMAAGAAGGSLAPRAYLGFRRRRRVAAFEEQFGDALEVLVGALESGSNPTAALDLVSREMAPPLATEFARVLRDMGVGLSLEEAFTGLHDRLPSDDLGMLVSALSIQFRVGGSLAGVLESLAETVRERERIRGEVRSLTAQQRLTARLLTALPWILVAFLCFANRDYMRYLLDPGLPRLLAAGAAGMVLAGGVLLRRVATIDL